MIHLTENQWCIVFLYCVFSFVLWLHIFRWGFTWNWRALFLSLFVPLAWLAFAIYLFIRLFGGISRHLEKWVDGD